MAIKFIKLSVIYFSIGVVLGLYMSISHNYNLSGVHVHINLLGWMSLALVGIIYSLFPNLSSTKLAKVHFWLHNLSLPVMMIGLSFVLNGFNTWIPLVAASGTVLVLAIILFTFNILVHLKNK